MPSWESTMKQPALLSVIVLATAGFLANACGDDDDLDASVGAEAGAAGRARTPAGGENAGAGAHQAGGGGRVTGGAASEESGQASVEEQAGGEPPTSAGQAGASGPHGAGNGGEAGGAPPETTQPGAGNGGAPNGGSLGAGTTSAGAPDGGGGTSGGGPTCTAPKGNWTAAGDMNTVRGYHAAVLLQDGKALVLGGITGYSNNGSGFSTPSAELYDPATESWSQTGSMAVGRAGPAVLLQDGTVLVPGGFSTTDSTGSARPGACASYTAYPSSSVEIYDPAAGSWVAAEDMTYRRAHHTATLLANGEVLVVGGDAIPLDGLSSGAQRNQLGATAELYDPSTGSWTPTGSMSKPRHYHTATALADGRVLVVGGSWNDSVSSSCVALYADAEVYDPASGTWTGEVNLVRERATHTATLLADGTVLIAGGDSSEASAEIYDPATGTSTATGRMSTVRKNATASLLCNGTVLVAGGYHQDATATTVGLESAELYDPSAGTWTVTTSMSTASESHAAVRLANGDVLIAGGHVMGTTTFLSRAEVY
jgi:hypothetical protein